MKKDLFLALVPILLFGLVGCAAAQEPVREEGFPQSSEELGLALSVKDVSSNKLTLVFTYEGGPFDSDDPPPSLDMGKCMLQISDGTTWEDLRQIELPAAGTMSLDGVMEIPIQMLDPLPSGSCRITQTVADFQADPVVETTLGVTFELP